MTTPGVEAGPVMTEYVQPSPVAEYVTPVSAAPAVTYAAPAHVAESVPLPQVPIVEKTIEIPQLQIVEKIVEIPEPRTIQGTQTSESFGNCSRSTRIGCGVCGHGGIVATFTCCIYASCVRDGTHGRSSFYRGGVRPTCSYGHLANLGHLKSMNARVSLFRAHTRRDTLQA